MKYIYILASFFCSAFSFSQDYIKTDSLLINNESYETFHISYGSSSFYKSFVVFSIYPENVKSTKDKIIECFKENKLEHTEIYLIAIPKIDSKKSQILEEYLLKIDLDRMKNNLFSALIPCSSDSKFKFTYYTDQQRKKISEFNYLYELTEKDNVCKLLKK